MTPERLAEIRAAVEKLRAPGWCLVSPTVLYASDAQGEPDSERRPRPDIGVFPDADDAAFAALARSAVPELLAFVEFLAGLIRDLQTDSSAYQMGYEAGKQWMAFEWGKATAMAIWNTPLTG